jgi:prolyl-tRNA synthetase
LGQNFAKAFDVKFQAAEGGLQHVFATSWGVSTRLIGTLIMAHSDDKGLVIPPRLAPVQVVIVPIGRGDDKERVLAAADSLAADLKNAGWDNAKIRVKVDKREKESPGFKFNEWELKGACVRIELGPRDLDGGICVVSRRDVGEKVNVALGEAVAYIQGQLSGMQTGLLETARVRREAATQRVDTWAEFLEVFKGEGGAGFVVAHWDGTQETEDAIAEATKATIRCIPIPPLDPADEEPGVCVFSGKPSERRVVFAKAY